MPCDQETPAKCGQGTGKSQNFHLLPGVREQFASCEYLLNTNFYSHSADFIDLARNSPCLSAWMVEAELEAMRQHNLFFNTRECSQINNNSPIIFSIHSVFLTDRYHSARKMTSKRKSRTLEQRVKVMRALHGGCSRRDVALKFRLGKSQVSRIMTLLPSSYIHTYIYTLYKSIVNVRNVQMPCAVLKLGLVMRGHLSCRDIHGPSQWCPVIAGFNVVIICLILFSG